MSKPTWLTGTSTEYALNRAFQRVVDSASYLSPAQVMKLTTTLNQMADEAGKREQLHSAPLPAERGSK